ncbi:transporter [Clostridia bacterium]|nr:transporter [Clostridia bacterium]
MRGASVALRHTVAGVRKRFRYKPGKTYQSLPTRFILERYVSAGMSRRKLYREILRGRALAAVLSVLRVVVLAGLSFIIIYPLMYTLSTAFRMQADMTDPAVMWIPKHFTLQNFKDVWTALDYPTLLRNTLLVNIVCSVVQVVTCSLAGYGFGRFNFRFKKVLFGLVMLQIIVPVQILDIPLFSTFRYFDIFGIFTNLTGSPLNLVDSPVALYILAFFCNGIRSGLFILIFRQYYRSLPKDLEDSAYLDGCSYIGTFFKIILPNALVTHLTVLMFSIVWYWNDTYVTNMFFSNFKTVSTVINKDVFWRQLSMYLANTYEGLPDNWLVWLEAGCIMAMLPVFIIYFVFQRHFLDGVEKSGIAG